MKKQQSGFTLIELIAVLVILGILAATALPRFVDLSDAANSAAISATASTIESSSSLNYAVAVAQNAGLTTDTFVDVTACNAASINALLSEDLSGYTLATDTAFGSTPELGDTATCTIANSDGSGDTIEFILIYAEN